MSLCPCGTGKSYADCCKRYHDGIPAENALALMRSRYSAYAKQLPDYIIKTTHPSNPTYSRDTKKWSQEIASRCRQTSFDKLEIIDFTDGDPTAYVTFVAYMRQGQQNLSFKEKSSFVKHNGQWLYKDGLIEHRT